MLPPMLQRKGIGRRAVARKNFDTNLLREVHKFDDLDWRREIVVEEVVAGDEYRVSLSLNEFQVESCICSSVNEARERVLELSKLPRAWFEERHKTPQWLRAI